ncbi:MAG TPA: hypothetical protein VNL97_04325, partial [Solirubrobacterales bacterium]|nr:hypothetical protein [Solirubrobacterales bacterium]
LAHGKGSAAMSTAVGDDGGLSVLGEEDGKGLAEQHGSLRTVLQVLKPRDRLPAAAQRKGNVFAGWDLR